MALRGEIAAFVEAHHSTTALLGAGATFTGDPPIDTAPLVAVVVAVLTDQAGTVYVDSSPDGTHWDWSASLSVSANVQATLRASPPYALARVRYVNGGTPQTSMRLQTTLRMAGGVGGDGDNATETTLATLNSNVTSGAARVGVLGGDGTSIAAGGNGLPVALDSLFAPGNGGDTSISQAIANTTTPLTNTPTTYNRGMIVLAPSTNAETVWLCIGAATVGKGFEMRPGTSISFAIWELQDPSVLQGITAGGGSCKINVVGLTQS